MKRTLTYQIKILERKVSLLIQQNHLLLNPDLPLSDDSVQLTAPSSNIEHFLLAQKENKYVDPLSLEDEGASTTDATVIVKEEAIEAADQLIVNDSYGTGDENFGSSDIEPVFDHKVKGEEQLGTASDTDVTVKCEPPDDDNHYRKYEHIDSSAVSYAHKDSDEEANFHEAPTWAPIRHDPDAIEEEKDSVYQSIYPCYQCNSYAESFKKLQRHKEKAHGSYSCDQCVYSAQHACHLKKHKEKVHNRPRRSNETENKKKQFLCVQCNFSCTRSWQLKRHKDEAHLGKRYKCDECSHLFSRPEHLKKHKSKIHSRHAHGPWKTL